MEELAIKESVFFDGWGLFR